MCAQHFHTRLIYCQCSQCAAQPASQPAGRPTNKNALEWFFSGGEAERKNASRVYHIFPIWPLSTSKRWHQVFLLLWPRVLSLFSTRLAYMPRRILFKNNVLNEICRWHVDNWNLHLGEVFGSDASKFHQISIANRRHLISMCNSSGRKASECATASW